MKLKIEDKLELAQKLKLSLNMKLSLRILEMSGRELKKLVYKENNKFLEKINFSSYIKKNNDDDEFDPIENLTEEKDFYKELEGQLIYFKTTKKIKEIAIFIINNLNEKGFLEISKFEIKKLLKLSDKELDTAFSVVYDLEPYGIAAYSLEESLKLQLIKKGIQDEKLFLLLDKYLYFLADKEYELIAKKLSVDIQKVKDYEKEIKKLNPIPTRGYSIGKIQKIEPDVILEISDNNIAYQLNRDLLINLDINFKNRNSVSLEEKYLYTAIEKRFKTMEKIVGILIKYQKEFFLKGKDYLKTLRIKDIAYELEMSESTISRAMKEKYIKTGSGIIAFKTLICQNSDVISEKKIIEKIIEEENREKPYSDEQIKNILNDMGIEIARRTVAKYRNELGYKTMSKRKIEITKINF